MKTIALVGKPQPSFVRFLAETRPDLRVIAFADHRDSFQYVPSLAAVYPTDFSSAEAVTKTLNEAQEREIIGVHAGYENSVVPKAWITEYYGLPGLKIEDAMAATDKRLMRERFVQFAPEYTPAFRAVSTWNDVAEFTAHYGYPVILKPANLAKSLLVTKNNSETEMRQNFEFAQEKIAAIYKQYGVHHRTPQLIVEEYLEGPSFSVDVLSDVTRKTIPLPVVDLIMARDLGVPDNYNYSRKTPSVFSTSDQQALQDAAVRAAQAVNITHCATHAELVLTKTGPKIIEVGARAGGYRKAMYELSFGISYHEHMLNLITGQPISLQLRQQAHSAVYEIFPDKLGQLKKITHVEDAQQLPSYHDMSLRNKPGDMVGLSSQGYKFAVSFTLANPDKNQFENDCRFIEQHVKALV